MGFGLLYFSVGAVFVEGFTACKETSSDVAAGVRHYPDVPRGSGGNT